MGISRARVMTSLGCRRPRSLGSQAPLRAGDNGEEMRYKDDDLEHAVLIMLDES